MSRLQKLLSEFLEHVFGHFLEAILMLPIPFTACTTIIHQVRPRLGNRLFQGIDVVNHLKLGLVLLDVLVDRSGSKLMAAMLKPLR